MSKPGRFPFYISLQTGSVQTRPILTRYRPLDLGLVDPDQSNVSEAFRRSGSTSMWVELGSIGLLGFFKSFPEVLANCTHFLAI